MQWNNKREFVVIFWKILTLDVQSGDHFCYLLDTSLMYTNIDLQINYDLFQRYEVVHVRGSAFKLLGAIVGVTFHCEMIALTYWVAKKSVFHSLV